MSKLIEITGKAISGEWGEDDELGTGIPVLRTTNFTNNGVINYASVVTRQISKKNLAEKYLRKGDIIIEKSGGSDNQPVGRVVFFDADENKYLFNNFTGVLRVKDCNQWHPRYVFWALYSNYSNGGTRKYQNKTTGLHNLQVDQFVKDFIVPNCSIDEQIRVVTILDKVDNLISLRKKQLQKLDDLVKSRFVEMFKAESPSNCSKCIHDFAEVFSGFAFSSEDFCENAVPVIRISNINDRKVFPDHSICFPIDFWEKNERYRVLQGDILMAMSGATTGKAGISTYSGPLLLNQRVACIRAKKEVSTREFLFVATQLPWMYNLIQEASAGCAQPNISGKQIENMPIPAADYEKQKEFSVFANQIENLKLTVQPGLDKLELLKQSLMQKYFG